ncbi:hypothetical protein AGMMS49975_08850 [Clostridia bacterium]|nr:hypothetical protein AGMMS49975_08850 [Clostridia bacterium]
MAQLTADAITGYKQYTIDNIAFGKYKVGSTYYPLTILSKEIQPNGKMLVRVQCDHPSTGNITITEIQLYDIAGRLWYTDSVNYSLAAVLQSLRYRLDIEFTVSVAATAST